MTTSTQAFSEPAYKQAEDSTDLKHIPGKYGLPLIGRGLTALFNFPGMVDEHYRKWGEVSRIQMVDQKGVLVLGADNLQKVFLDKEKNFSNEMGYSKTLKNFYDKGLLMRDFDEHRLQRRIMQSAFKTDAMQLYISELNAMMSEQIKQLDTRDPLLFYPFIKELLLRIGVKIFIGVDNIDNEYRNINQAFLNISDGFLDQLKKEIPGTPFYRGRQGMRYLHDYFRKLIPVRRAGDGTDMLSYMCRETMEDGSYFSDDDIIAHAAFILFAAHDTTTSVLNHLMMYSAQLPEWQRRMREQSLSIGKETLDYADLERMTELDNGFHEAMRMHPPIPILIRRSIRDCEMGGYHIPANTVVMMAAIHNHYSDKYWKMPAAFDPDRFSAERLEHKNHSFCFFPFGGGAHKCIGMHFALMLGKTFMHQMLLNYDYELPVGFTPKLEWVPLPKPAKLPLILRRR